MFLKTRDRGRKFRGSGDRAIWGSLKILEQALAPLSSDRGDF
jgi:hypothetical protein